MRGKSTEILTSRLEFRILSNLPLLQCAWGPIGQHTIHTPRRCRRSLVQRSPWLGNRYSMYSRGTRRRHIPTYHHVRRPKSRLCVVYTHHRLDLHYPLLSRMPNSSHSITTKEGKLFCRFQGLVRYQIRFSNFGGVFGRVRCVCAHHIHHIILAASWIW